jgi:hypothetical protein
MLLVGKESPLIQRFKHKTAGMVHMKCDMAGGGAVFGAMQLIADFTTHQSDSNCSLCREFGRQ